MEDKAFVKVRVTIARDEEYFFGPGIVRLLDYIDETGSVKEACRRMGLSYTKGWHILNRAEKQLGFELITRNRGGREGGGAAVTEKGTNLIARYKQMEQEILARAREIYDKTFPEGLP